MKGKRILLMFASFLVVLATATSSTSICQKLNDICVPSQDFRQDCQCVLTKPGLVNDEKALLLNNVLGSSDHLSDIRYEFLSRKAMTTLNNFFSTSESVRELNRNIFKDVKYEIHVELMTIEQSKAHHLFNLLNANHLSAAVKNHLSHCSLSHCEQSTILQDHPNNVWNRKSKKFISERAMRMDFANLTMIAFATANSECVLEYVLHEYQDKVCKVEWVFWQKCWNETKFAERLRPFTASLRYQLSEFVLQQMVNHFRMHYYKLMS